MSPRVAFLTATTVLACTPAVFAANFKQALASARSSGKPVLAIAGHEG